MYLRLRIATAAFMVCLLATAVSAPHHHIVPPTPTVDLAAAPVIAQGPDPHVELQRALIAAQAEYDANVAAWIANAPPPPAPPPPTRVAARTQASAPAPTDSTPPPAGSGSATAAISQYFGDIYDSAVRVAQCESGLDPGAISPGGGNWGLFQINTTHKADFENYTGQPWSAVLNADYNAMYARKLYDGNGGWGPWTCKRVA